MLTETPPESSRNQAPVFQSEEMDFAVAGIECKEGLNEHYVLLNGHCSSKWSIVLQP